MCLIVRINRRRSDPPPGRRKWGDSVNCYDGLVENNDSLVENDDSLVENDDSLVENDDSLVENNDSLVENDDSLVENDDSLVENDDSLVKNNDSLVENDDSLVENGGAPRYLWICAFNLTIGAAAHNCIKPQRLAIPASYTHTHTHTHTHLSPHTHTHTRTHTSVLREVEDCYAHVGLLPLLRWPTFLWTRTDQTQQCREEGRASVWATVSLLDLK